MRKVPEWAVVWLVEVAAGAGVIGAGCGGGITEDEAEARLHRWSVTPRR